MVIMSSNYVREENQCHFNDEFINNDKGIIYCWIYEGDKSKPFIGSIEYCTKDNLRCVDWNTNNTIILTPSDIVTSSTFTILSKCFSSRTIENYEYSRLVNTNTVYKFNCCNKITKDSLHNDDMIKITYKHHNRTAEYTTRINFICSDYIDIDIPNNNREAWLEEWHGVVTKYVSGAYDEFQAYSIFPKNVAENDVTIELIKPMSSPEIKPVTNARFDFPTAMKYLISGQQIRHTTWSKDKYLFFDVIHQVVLDEDSKFVNIMKYANLDNWEIKE
jgi:hypothetical protein